MTLDFVLSQLYAMRNQIDALILVTQELHGQAPQACLHQETEDAGSTLGHPRRRCVNPSCRAVLEG